MTRYDQLPPDRIRWGLVLNDLDDEVLAHPRELSGWILRRAEGLEVDLIRPEMHRYARAIRPFAQPSQESKVDREQTSVNSVGFRYTPLESPSRFRYALVVPSTSPTLPPWQLAEALRIGGDLWVEHWHLVSDNAEDTPQHAPGGNAPACVQYFAGADPREPQAVDLDHLAHTVEARLALDDEVFASISRAIALFREYDVVPEFSLAKLLGYFAVIESLLSHPPSGSDSVDSVTRQFIRNLVLVDHQLLSGRLGLDGFSAKPKKVIEKLYSLRSALAHGADPSSDFDWFEQNRPLEWAGEFERLWIHKFMRRLTRRILDFALQQPRLTTDLR